MRYFITNVLPHHLSGKYKISYAASNFSWALIHSEVFDEVFSIAPLNVTGDIDDVQMNELVYSKWRKKRAFLRYLAPIREQVAIFKKIKSGSSVWFYNISPLNIVLFFLCKWFKPSVQCNVIVLDIYIPKSRISLDTLCLWTINHAHANIRLSDSPRFTCQKSECLPGVVPLNAPDLPKVSSLSWEFLLSGLLREDISQISLVIKVFSQLPNAILHITGFSERSDLLKAECEKYPNIHFHGELPFSEYIELLHRVPFLLSTRDPKEEGNQCNFPSKVIEGILHNRIIVSTIKYNQLSGLNYFYISSEENESLQQFSNIINMENAELLRYANQSEKAKVLFSPLRWGETMSKLEAN